MSDRDQLAASLARALASAKAERQEASTALGFALAVGACIAVFALAAVRTPALAGSVSAVPLASGTGLACVVMLGVRPLVRMIRATRKLDGHDRVEGRVRFALRSRDTTCVNAALEHLRERRSANDLVEKLRAVAVPQLERLAVAIREEETRQRIAASRREDALRLRAATAERERHVRKHLDRLIDRSPVVRTMRELEASAEHLGRRRAFLQEQWTASYPDMSWWNKAWYGQSPDFSKMDALAARLNRALRDIHDRHGDDLESLSQYVERAKRSASERLATAHRAASFDVAERGRRHRSHDAILRNAMWLSVLSVPFSVWADAETAADVHDVLRAASGTFADMSADEIWFETLTMPAERLAGLSSLVKGAYFESLVASDTGGALHEHFNHPDTDIVIDGVAFQIKATDSSALVEEVDASVPVIATSEVAAETGALDGGYTDAELTESVELALGGSVFDTGDAGIDAILMGLGGVGLFAGFAGLNHAVKCYENGGDAVEAAFAGAGITALRTARAVVGTAELGYRALTSRPARAVGRGLIGTGRRLVGSA